jgi:beta propeller repeat protein
MKASSSSALIGIAALLAGTLAFFAAGPAHAANPTLSGTSVTINNGGSGAPSTGASNPAVSGDWVVYTDDSTGQGVIHYYDLATSQDASIDTEGGFDGQYGDAISGTTVVYSHEDTSGNYSIYAYDIGSGNPPAALDDTGDLQIRPAIGGDTVAWNDYGCNSNNPPGCNTTISPGYPQVMVYDTATQALTDLSDDPTTANWQEAVSPDGSVVVWSKCNEQGDVCQVWEGIAGTGGTWSVSELASSSGGSVGDEQPQTNGNIVVYQSELPVSNYTVPGGIYWQPVGGGTEQEVPFPAGFNASYDPHVSGDLISFVSENTSTGESEIFVYSLATQTLYQVTNTPDEPNEVDNISVTPDGVASLVWMTLNANDNFQLDGFTFQAPSLTVTTTSLPDAGYGQPYSQTLATSGTGPDTWAVTGGALPPGLTLDPASGTISGTPTAAGPASFTVSATDTGNPAQTATQQLTLTVDQAPLTVTASGGSMTYGGTVPTISASYAGFVTGDSAASLTTAPSCSTTATPASPVGSYRSSCTGAVDPDYSISYVSGQVTVTQATTSLAYTGPQSISAGTSLVPAATLSSMATACQASQLVSFSLATNPTGAVGSYSLGSATTNGSGVATTAAVSTVGWQAGAYTLTASYAGTGNCGASTATAPLVVTTAGLAAAGAGTYSITSAGPVGFGFIVAQIPHTSSYLGAISLVNTGSWRLAGTLSGYNKSSATQGTVTGTGSLYWWNPALSNGHGGWQLAKTGVAFTASFTATTSASPGSFGIQISYTPVSPQPPTLPNSSPVSLKSGAIVMA